ncbi:MAG TPA: ABC transporter permease [Acidimicrobiia bacterium]|nr:ABC transporter permease [Acidimicrobiia bacterium]
MASQLEAPDSEAVGQARWTWPALALPGVLWLILLFITPFYALFSVAMGTRHPIFLSAQPEWNPLRWNPAPFGEVFADLFGGRLGLIAGRTLVYVAVACLLCVAIGYPVAYFVSRRAGRWRGPLLVLLLAPFWINYLMRMLAWVNLLSPDGYVNRIMGFLGGGPVDWLAGRPSTVVLGMVYGYIPFFILPLYAALDRIDKNTLEAARDLGASPIQAFRRVTLPMSKHGILAGLVIVMLPMFGDYYTPNLLSGSPRTRLIGNEIDAFINQSTSQGGQGAALTIVLMAFVAILMAYYLLAVAKSAREARR